MASHGVVGGREVCLWLARKVMLRRGCSGEVAECLGGDESCPGAAGVLPTQLAWAVQSGSARRCCWCAARGLGLLPTLAVRLDLMSKGGTARGEAPGPGDDGLPAKGSGWIWVKVLIPSAEVDQ